MPRYSQETKNKALGFRRRGYSTKQIASKLKIAKSTSSLWVRDINMGVQAKSRIDRRSADARSRGALERKRRLAITYRVVEGIVKDDLKTIGLNLKLKRLLCAFLYWGEGAKTFGTIKFTNSDPKLVALFLKLFRESFVLDELRLAATLHLHSYHDERKQLLFWSNVTKIPIDRIHIYRKQNSGNRIKENYPGCITVNYSNSRLFTALTSYYKYFDYAGLV